MFKRHEKSLLNMANKAAVTPHILTWARQRRGVKASDLADKIRVSSEAILEWESGKRMPTFLQAQKLAQSLYIPFGYLYLAKPPVEKMPIADFRTTRLTQPEPSPDLLDHLNDILGKQQWLKEYRKSENADEIPFVGRFDITDSVDIVARDIRDTLDVDGARQEAYSWEALLRSLIHKAETLGIMVMRSGVVCGNNHRPLDVTEFRGLSMVDRIAPLIFINTRDFKGAQIFTLIHEMAHIWTGKGGVSNPDYGLQSKLQDMPVELFCNRVAAEALVPSRDFRSKWRSNNVSYEDNLEMLRKHYKVSMMVALRQALDSGLIDVAKYQKHYAQLVIRAETATASDVDDKSGGHFYRTLIARNGRSLVEAVISSVAQGTTLSSEGAHMLGVQVKSLSGVAGHMRGVELDSG